MKKISLSTKLLYFYVIVLLVSLILNVFIYDYLYSEEYDKQLLVTSQQKLNTVDVTLNLIISEVLNFSSSAISNQSLHEAIIQANQSYTPQNDVYITNLLFNISKFSNIISSLSVFDLKSNVYNYKITSDYLPDYSKDYAKESWYQQVQNKKGGATLFLNEINQSHKKNKFEGISIVRQINDFTNLTEIGLMSVNINTNIIKKSIEPLITEKNSKLVILYEDGRKFLDIGWDDYDINNTELLYLNNGENKFVDIDGNKYVISATTNTLSELKIIYCSSIENLQGDLKNLKTNSLFIAIISTILIVVFTLAISQKTIKPINALIISMNRIIDEETFNKVELKTGHDEIGTLKDIYNIMIEKIQNLIKNLVKEENLKHKAELIALQAQIKPHFLYNTFDTISSLALNDDTQCVYEMTRALSSYYRLSLSSGNELIKFEEEINIIENYVFILKIRYQQIFDVEYYIDEKALSCYIPKLTLQPFVENSIYHGIRPLGEKGLITIKATIKCEKLMIEIIDDGIGMDEETVERITQPDKNRNISFGVKSTMERIRLLFDQQGNVDISSKKNIGTTITIKIPAKEQLYEEKF